MCLFVFVFGTITVKQPTKVVVLVNQEKAREIKVVRRLSNKGLAKGLNEGLAKGLANEGLANKGLAKLAKELDGLANLLKLH